MIEMEMENERVTQLQRFGDDWIQALAEKQLDRLEQFCHPEVVSRLLTPRHYFELDNAVDLVAKYHDWFDECTDLQVVETRVDRVGGRLGIFYRFRLRKREDWYVIEQQVYCTLRDGRVERLHLLCSGFQLVELNNQAESADAPAIVEQDPIRDELLEFYLGGSNNGSTCALLTPAIKSKLREMQTGQVLEVRVDDPTARGDIEAWSRLSGNALLKVIDGEGQILRFFVQKK